MTPGKYNMVCPQGSTFNQQLTYTIEEVPVDLTGYSARMQVREKHTSTRAVFDLTTENGGLTTGGAAGTIIIFISSTDTSEASAKDYVYDIELESSGGDVTRLLEGKFMLTPEVTR